MKKIKKADGTIAEVEDNYVLQVGETEEASGGGDGDGDGGEEGEKAMKENLKKFIKDETIDQFNKELDARSNELVKKFFDGVAAQRAKIIEGKAPVKKSSDQEVVRKWFGCLVNRDYAGMKQIQKDYMNGADDASGAYLIPPQLVAEVNRFVEFYGVARRDMRYLPFSGPGNERTIPALDSSVSVFWVGEAGTKPSTKPTFKVVTQTLKKIAAIVPMTEEILEDSAIDIIKLLGELFGEAVAMEEDRVFLAGSTGAGDPFNGVINATGIVPTLMTAGDDANDINADDLLDLIYSVPTQIRNNGKFYLNSTILKCIQKVKSVTDGHYIWQGPVGGQPGTIWNRPYETVDILPDDTLTTHSAPFMFFTDLKKTCVYGDKQGLRVKLLEEGIVQSADESPSDLNLATNDMVALRIVKRVGYVPVLPSGIAVLKVAAT